MPNTLSSDIVPDVASDVTVTTFRDMLVGLDCFHTDFTSETVNATRGVQIPVVPETGTVQKGNIASYQVGDSTVNSAFVKAQEYNISFHITQAELNEGHRIERLFRSKLRILANEIMDDATAIFTTANGFTKEIIAPTSADLDRQDLKDLWASADKFSEKNLLLTSSYYSNFIPEDRDQLRLADGYMEFDKFRYTTRFNSSDNVVGLVADPQAAAMVARLPEIANEVRNLSSRYEIIPISDLGISVVFMSWADLVTRDMWCSFGLVFGSGVVDPSAAKLIATA